MALTAATVVQQLPQIEALCERLYTSQVQQERTKVEEMLRVFSSSTEQVASCKAILDNSKSAYAQILATSSLLKIVTDQILSLDVKKEMRIYFLQYLDRHGPSLEPFVFTSLAQLLCRLTKLNWFQDEQFTRLVDDSRTFLEKGSSGASQGHYLLGLRILNLLVTEMNQPTQGRTLTQHRKLAVAFRDTALLKVFQLALASLRALAPPAQCSSKLQEQAVGLSLACLSFDFFGTCMDDSSEDLSTIQVPGSWRSLIEDPASLKLFLDFYRSTEPPLSNQALECLVRLASVRRSLFTDEASRSRFLAQLVSGSQEILQGQQGLAEHANYHEFCRLLGRLKTNYQLSELVALENYAQWIQLVAELTVNSLNSWQWASSSVYYLLGLWSRLVSSMPYLKGDGPSMLETFVPKITEAYVASRMDAVPALLQDQSLEDPLDSPEQLHDQLESLSYLCRFQYEQFSEYLCGLMDPILGAYTQALTSPGVDENQVALMEGRLTWLIHIISTTPRASASAESQEMIDGELSVRVFELIRATEGVQQRQRYTLLSRQRLEVAITSFLQAFRKIYVGEQVMNTSKVYVRLSEQCGLGDHLSVLNVMLSRIANNMKTFVTSEEVVTRTLELFQDLAQGYSSGKLLLKLDAITFMLQHHAANEFPFLDDPANARNRTTLHSILAKLLFMEDTPGKFKTFVMPFQQVFVHLTAASNGATNAQALRSSVPESTVVGLMRDLRGVAQATNSRKTYGLLFDWLHPQHFPIIRCCLEAWADKPSVSTAVLKFMAEFVQNKTQRLTFDPSSPNGILLFREVSKILVTYGRYATGVNNAADVYTQKFKGISICMLILTRTLVGYYVNFGVFELYGDPALK
ncbi:hypothetical protein WJX84_008704 [Apatococcus fuscideae]